MKVLLHEMSWREARKYLVRDKIAILPMGSNKSTIDLVTVDQTDSGVFGKGTTAFSEKGKKVFGAVVDELVRHVRLLKKARIEDLMQKPRV